ncbi:cobaltochelatase subunit CobN [Methanococcoides sp. AM1]|uniref:cobaltochelatase subunit CobN n=1 Tax=Methanococcoides sp. AM1 TaxID=1201011 RepID=UPI0010832674|nr:cobaltochelatase subunit CobN [Methanococcoides sp. AM1]
MRNIRHQLLLLSVLILLAISPVVSAEEQVTKITYISYGPNEALDMASQTNDYSDLIEYTFIDFSDSGLSADMVAAAESGFLETQDVILCQGLYGIVFENSTVNESLQAAHDKGTALYSIEPMGYTPPAYFDYNSDGSTNDPVANYYTNMDTSGEGLENAENLLTYLTLKSKITYISYGPNEALDMASQTNDYSDLIEYTFIDFSDSGLSADMVAAAESGFLETQDVILCQGLYGIVFENSTVNESLQAAHDKGTALYSIEPMGYTPPAYFDYNSDGSTNDPVANYYTNMDTSGEGLENAENLLVYLATECPTLSRMAIMGNEVNFSEFVFVLGTDFNELSLTNASLDTNISSQLNITIFTKDNPVPEEFDFSNYGMIFIESQDESVVNNWTSSIKSAKTGGAMVIGYNLSSNITLPNVDLYTTEYTDIERYWVQGGDANMGSMLKFMGQNFSGLWEGEEIPEPELLRPKINITYIMNYGTDNHYLLNVLGERSVITDRFNVTVMDGAEAAANLTDVLDQDVIILGMIGGEEFPEFKDALLVAKANGTQIGLIATTDMYGVGNINMTIPPHSAMVEYHNISGYTNMENWIRCIGSTLGNAYIEYSPAVSSSIPLQGIYHPDAFPRIFGDSTEYLEWYADNGYNESAPTIGIITYSIVGDPKFTVTDDAVISYLESKGCNVIYTTKEVCTGDVDYFIKDGEVLVDSIISLKGFYLNYDDHEAGVEYLKSYNVPVLKGALDGSKTPDEYNASVQGLDLISIASQVAQPEIDGCIDYIWIAGLVTVGEGSDKYEYYKPIMSQVEWLCDRAIGWAELGNTNNADKKVSIIYYNHEGGKNNIGASYLDIGSSFTLMLEQMQAEGYDIGNGSIPNGSEFIDLFIESRNVGSWAPGELEKVVNSGNVTLVSVDEYLSCYNTLPESVRAEVEATWGPAPGDIMVYEGNFVIPKVQFGNVNFIPQPTRAGLSDESLIYHNESIPPTHQYLATYFWINNIYDADALIHFGTHSTQEWLPGKEVGLWRYDYPAIMVADTPVIYPYLMDNVGEGTQAKRRGNAVIIDHLTPPIVQAGIYAELAMMHDKMHNYEDARDANNTEMMQLYRNSTIELYESLTMENDLGVTPDELRAMTEDDFGTFIGSTVHNYLHELQDTLMPLGLHTFGVPPQDSKLVCMVKSMLRSDFIDHIYNVIPKDTGDEEDWEDNASVYATELLNATLLNGTNVSTAQIEILSLTDANITADLNMALNYSGLLNQTTREIDQTLRALNAEYIEPGPGNDPIRNPEALPTGRNFYSFDQRLIPDAETETMGAILAEQMLEQYKATHNGTYPNKVCYVLWATETMRHKGLMEAQIYALLGVDIHRDTGGRFSYFTIIDQENMTHPRIDVVITPSGLYRDTYPFQLEKMDEAIREVADRNETNATNYVRWNSLKMEDALIAAGYNNTTAHDLSQCRIFTEAPGAYGTGLPEATSASDTWDNESELADLYLSRMSNIYGADMWGESYEDVFRLNLMDVDAAIHSDSTNLIGVIDNDDFFQYLGGLGLAVRSLTGENPEMYIANFENPDNLEIITLQEHLRKEMRSRYLNPAWIEGMMGGEYAGAREMMKFTDNMWGWDAMMPDLITDSDWKAIYDIYVMDKYDLGLDEFLKTENPYQYQSITARMIETARKDYWDASDEVLQNLVKEYVESVVNDGVTCCHHTCGNALLDEYVQGIMSVPGVVDQATIDEYNKLMQEATHRYPETSGPSRSSSDTPSANIVNSTSTSNDATGYGTATDQPTDASQQSTPDNYVEGYEMTRENTPKESASSSFSGSDVMGALLVLASVGMIYFGFMRKK